MIYKVLWNASILATGAAGAIGSFHTLQSFYRQSVLAESSIDDTSTAKKGVPHLDLDLELKQVQVFFRHGARTPLHTIEGFHQVPYDVDLVMRPHVLTLFPYERISSITGLPVDWGSYELTLRRKNLLRGGSIPGHLTSYGQEQMYGLGLRIRETYGKQLGLSSFDPSHFYVLSTNITRTVESARCVIAGIYGNDCLTNYALQNGPVQIKISGEENNILVPDSRTCKVLRNVNHAALLHFDYVPSMKADRENLEKHIDNNHDHQQNELIGIQAKVSKALESFDNRIHSANDQNKTTTAIAYNEADRQPYTYDKQLYESVKERNQATKKVSHFWHNAITHHPTFAKHLPKEELRVLMHLKQVEMEEFHLKFKSGYRFRFHFDSNPFFHNDIICKEIVRRPDGSLVSTVITDIKWKTGKPLEIKHRSKPIHEDQEHCGDEISFFSWLTEKDLHKLDVIGDSLKELWRNPLDFYQYVSYKMDHSTTKKINFVFLYDDMKARATHGWSHPKELSQFLTMTERNGTRMMFYGNTGRHKRERPTVISLSVGRLLTDMVKRGDEMMKGENPQRICLYSSHDSTMVPMLEVLGLWKNMWPPFGCDLCLEIYQDKKSSDFYVRVLYVGKAVKIRGQDSDLIRWDEFCRVVKPYMINQEEFKKICASNILEKVAKDVLVHEVGEVPDTKKSQKISETPAGM